MIATFNDIPIRTVNGVPIYVKDVAHVADGFAVQTNMVRRDGRRAVLMTILKGEEASTISVVNRVLAALPGIQAQLPPELKMEPLIVATSIPLSLLTSIIVLGALGYSLNSMTLGGMALVVGILVDDATVEIENVHRNMAMKKALRRAILDGASQIAVPAFVSTLAICIVFVPVTFLTGPAAYLFTPLALAVVFAMLASYFLSRTLVPTMVLYLLPKEAEAEAHAGNEKAGLGANAGRHASLWSLIRHPSSFHAAFNRGFERLRLAYHGLLDWALDYRGMTAH